MRRATKSTRAATAKQVAAVKAAALGGSQTVTQGRSNELRALTVFDRLPAKHSTFLATEDGAEPHLCKGEFAVVDTIDREPQHGELYVIQYRGHERRRRLIQVTSSQLNITGPGAPYQTEHLQSRLIGRVVGVAFTALGNQLAPVAGWEDEEAGNAAFDPVEYLDVLLATGHWPLICGGTHYYEQMPLRALTKAEDAAVMAVRWKFAKASTALKRIKAECLRRGLTDDRSVA